MGGGDVRLGESRWLVTGEHPRVRSWTSPMRRGARTKTYPPEDRENTPSSTTRWKWHLAVGPVAGYTWVDRSIYQEPASGFLAGGSAVLSREVARSLQIGLDASATWSLVGSPPFNDGLRDTDERAVGRRLRVGARITYWWSDT